jgi:hypothetical protein
MIRSITQAKPEEELKRLLKDLTRLFIIGCGTCTTLTKTGGIEEVARISDHLMSEGKMITGSLVLPVACDQLNSNILSEYSGKIEPAEAIIIMSCAFGAQTVASQLGKMIIPAVDTIFLGKESASGEYNEVCRQCGDCLLGETGGICPVVTCHKGLVNGPCGGTDDGKCEIDEAKDCAWTLIYNRLKEFNALDRMRRYQKPKNYNVEPRPGKIVFSED